MENVPAFLDKRWISSHFSDLIYLEKVQDKSGFVVVTTLEKNMEKYYKLYILMENKLFSKFGDRKYIELNKVYYTQDSHYKLCFANINYILDYKYEHGLVVCDVEPVSEVLHSTLTSKVESTCVGIIPSNPRSIYSPEFIQELINYGNKKAWSYISDESYVIGTIEHSKEGMCYDVNLNYELSKALYLLLLDIYDNNELNKWFKYRRARFNYNDILKKIKSDRISRKIVIDAWNVYAPCKKSKLLKIVSFFLAKEYCTMNFNL